MWSMMPNKGFGKNGPEVLRLSGTFDEKAGTFSC
jgi:hypothetical protein